MPEMDEVFPTTYAQARERFLAAAAAAGATLQSHRCPAPGAAGEALFMDVARLGPDEAEAVLLVSSACHGVEGRCGSAVQQDFLHDAFHLDGVFFSHGNPLVFRAAWHD